MDYEKINKRINANFYRLRNATERDCQSMNEAIKEQYNQMRECAIRQMNKKQKPPN